MKIINVRKKEISIKEPTKLLVEDEVAPEAIRFVIANASSIENIDTLSFYLQYKNKLNEYGVEALTKTYANGALTLDWYPSSLFTKESGRTEIQLFGVVGVYEETPDTRWSSIKATITLPENIGKEITLIDKRQRARLAVFLR